MHDDLLRLVAAVFQLPALQESMDHIDFFLLVVDGLGQSLPLLLVFGHILLMLVYALLILAHHLSVSILEQLDLPYHLRQLLLQLAVLELELSIREGCRLDILVHYFLYLDYFLDYLFDLDRSLDVDWLHFDLFSDFSTVLQLLGQTLNLISQFVDGALALGVEFIYLVALLLGSQELLLTLFL